MPNGETFIGGADEQSSAPLASDPFTRTDAPVWAVTLWPHRSLSREGFTKLMWFCTAAMSLPLIALARTPVALALAPYMLAALAALWLFFKVNYRRARLTEELRLWPDAIAVERREPAGQVLRWSANPYWVDVDVTDTHDIQRYLTLRGAGRRIELGAFLTPGERIELAEEIRMQIARLRRTI